MTFYIQPINYIPVCNSRCIVDLTTNVYTRFRTMSTSDLFVTGFLVKYVNYLWSSTNMLAAVYQHDE